MPLHNLTRFPRLEFIGAPTPLEYLPRFSDYLGREIFIKRDDVTPMAMGGNKLRKLEFLAADADAPRDKCTLSCAINGIHAAFHYLKKNYISGCVMTVPTGW